MFLLILSSAPETPILFDTDQPGALNVGSTSFREISGEPDGGLFLGFYDWLRTPIGEVVGVELILHDNRESVRKALAAANFGEWVTGDVFRVSIDLDAEIDPDLSVDQEFSVSRCYSDADSRAALLFDASMLVPTSILRATPAACCPVRSPPSTPTTPTAT